MISENNGNNITEIISSSYITVIYLELIIFRFSAFYNKKINQKFTKKLLFLIKT